MPRIVLSSVHNTSQVNGQILPCVFALLPNKAERTYDRLLREVLLHTSNYENGPTDILVDFERAAINATERQIPLATVNGCFFHLSSNMWKHIQTFGLQGQYMNNDIFALHLRMIAALACAPPNDVIASFDMVADEIRLQYGDVADDILEYFEDT